MKTIQEFIENLNNENIDLIDKLENLSASAQISEVVCNLCQEKDNFESVEDYIREILQGQVGNSELTDEYIDFIVEETENLYEQGLIDESDDFTGGLYNCDDLYLYAIADVLNRDIDELTKEEYEEMTR